MLNTDDFLILVPLDGLPKLLPTGADVSEYVGQRGVLRVNKTVALNDNRSVTGSIIRLRETSAADEIHIMDLMNRHFRAPRAGEDMTAPRQDGPGTVPGYAIEKVLRQVNGFWIV